MSSKDLYLYFHSPCFDGIASSVLLIDFLETQRRYKLKELVPVNYDQRSEWVRTTLKKHSAVVDFLYHPEAVYWADHHLTTFISDEVENDFNHRKNQYLTYEPSSPSCAELLWNHLKEAFNYRNHAYSDLVKWATKIDAAKYENVEEAIFGDSPAIKIRAGLAQKGSKDLSVKLVKELKSSSLEEVAKLPEIVQASREITRLTRLGLKRFKKSSRVVDDNIVIFDVDNRDVLIDRYSPYYFYPEARYSLGLIRSEKGITITAMRNPWLKFQSMYLGRIFEKFGGGGHRRVGSVVFPTDREADAKAAFFRLFELVRDKDTRIGGHSPRDQEFQFL